MTTILLDSGPIGLVTNPKMSERSLACTRWLQDALAKRARVLIPEIADYEVRRELLRAGRDRGVASLDMLARHLEFLPINTLAMRLAARFWAQARQRGQPTADDRNIDADMILVAQASTLRSTEVVIATTNVGHLSRFARAALWDEITVM